MAHHGGAPFHQDDEGDHLDPKDVFGETGRYPEGKITEDDEGEIRFGVAEKDGKVVLNFGKKIRWIAATPEQAKDLAGSLLNKARQAGG